MTNAKRIWTKLLAAGLTPAGAAGLLGNFQAESALDPQNLQNTCERRLGMSDAAYTAAVDAGKYADFANDAAGYGLAQWTYSKRKAALLAYAKSQGKSIGDLGMQVDFALTELRESYPAVWNVLTTTASVQEASDAVLTQFERPADMSAAVRKLRGEYAFRFYAQLQANVDTAPEEADSLPHPPMPEQRERVEVRVTVNGKVFEGVIGERE